MKVSVITPTNRLGGLKLNLMGLNKQTFPKSEFEVIIIDDHPHPFTLAPFEYGLNIKYLRSKPASWRSNALIANARNTGLIHATGEVIIFLDDYSWIRPQFVQHHYQTNLEGYCLIGPVTSIEYTPNPPEDPSALTWRHTNGRIRFVEEAGFAGYRDKIYKEHRIERQNCPAGWFFTSNASAPLNKIIEINGFWELADLTREEDVMMGLALERVGCRFWFKAHPECTVFHMDHGFPQLEAPKKYRHITYEELEARKINGFNTAPDEVQLVTKDIYGTAHPGSWGLIEYWRRGHRFNSEIGFDLKAERQKRGMP